MANLTDSQLESIYNAAYAASDAWKKERNDLIDAHTGVVQELGKVSLELGAVTKERDNLKVDAGYWKSNSEAQREIMKGLEEDIEELTRANQQLANQRDQDLNALGVATDERDMYKQSRDYWKGLYEEASDDRYKLEQELSNLKFSNSCDMATTLSTEQRVTMLESTVGINSKDIYNLLLRVSKLETNK
jgi:chromosome segregation ATPase